jgi:hypothetical protein
VIAKWLDTVLEWWDVHPVWGIMAILAGPIAICAELWVWLLGDGGWRYILGGLLLFLAGYVGGVLFGWPF